MLNEINQRCYEPWNSSRIGWIASNTACICSGFRAPLITILPVSKITTLACAYGMTLLDCVPSLPTTKSLPYPN